MSRRRTGPVKPSTDKILNDKTHHLVGDLAPQTPLGTPRTGSPSSIPPSQPVAFWLRWAVVPTASLKFLSIPILLYLSWETIAPHVSPGTPNPFSHFFLLSGHIHDSSANDPRYQKSYWDLLFIAYHIVFFSLFRQIVVTHLSSRVARYFGLRKPGKLERFGEQTYALVYHGTMSFWGYRIMTQLPTYWYRTDAFWIDYPHWDMKPELKRYYLTHSSFWLQQLLVMLLGLEKPRKDYYELIAHHVVTLWLIGWSYLINLTLIGQAVHMSMDIPDAFFAFSKLLNYIQWNTAKSYSFAIFIVIWTYFRHYLNIVIQISVVKEFDLIPAESRQWNPPSGAWLVWWMKWQIFVPLFLLHCINLFWYYLIWRVLVRALRTSGLDDERSDDEDDGDDEGDEKDD